MVTPLLVVWEGILKLFELQPINKSLIHTYFYVAAISVAGEICRRLLWKLCDGDHDSHENINTESFAVQMLVSYSMQMYLSLQIPPGPEPALRWALLFSKIFACAAIILAVSIFQTPEYRWPKVFFALLHLVAALLYFSLLYSPGSTYKPHWTEYLG